MAAKQVILYLAIVVLAVIATQVNSIPNYANNYAANKSHDLILGSRLPGDRLVLKQSVIKNSAWMQIVTEQKSFNISSYQHITMIKALDQKTNGNGAYASILAGGLGYNNVTIRFKSQRGHGINFVVEVYGRY